MLDEIKRVSKIIEKVAPEDVIILSHPDSDGLTSAALFDTYFIKNFGARCRKVFHPTREMPYSFIFHRLVEEKPRVLLILDALIKKYRNYILKLLESDTVVINADHHDVLHIAHKNYFDLNPHNWQIEFLNSSSLAWQILREIDKDYFDERSWIAGIGSVQDFCFHDNKLLFETMHRKGLSNILKYEDLFDSKLMKCAKMINASCRHIDYDNVYSKILNACIANSIEALLEDNEMLISYNLYIKKLNDIYKNFIKTYREYPNINLIAYKHYQKAGPSLIAEICEMDRKPLIYFGYCDGLLGFCSLFYDYDVRNLARLFDGNGPHPKIAGGKTKKSFEEVINLIFEYFHSLETPANA